MPRRISPKCDGSKSCLRKRVKKFGKPTSFVKAWDVFQRIRAGEYPLDFPSDIKGRKKRQAPKLARFDSRIDSGQSPVGFNKISRDFDVIRPVSGSIPDRFLSTCAKFCLLGRELSNSFKDKVFRGRNDRAPS
jgi:hypothetical protein